MSTIQSGHGQTWFRQACRHSILGNVEAAVSALRAGLDEGQWWSPRKLEDDGDLEPIRGTADFVVVREECGRRFRAAQALSRPQCLVLAPSTATWEPRTLVVIHRRGDTAASFVGHWRQLVDQGWTLIVPQSSQVYDSAGFCWDDAELARRELRGHLDDCRRKRGIQMDGMTIAGASQGGRLALELAHEAGLPWLSVIPSFPAGYDVSPLIAVPAHTRGAFLLGEHDPANTRSRPVVSALESGGVRVIARTMREIGHDLPDDFIAQAAEALKDLMDE
jgi:predicted esterase